MKKPDWSNTLTILCAIVLFCALMQGWEHLVRFVGIVFAAVVPLVLGMAIAYVVSIPTNFLSRHFMPNSTSPLVEAIRRPVALAITVALIVVGLGLSSSVLIPALLETVVMVQENGQAFVEDVLRHPFFNPIREAVLGFLHGDLVERLVNMDIGSLIHVMFGGTMGTVTTQLFTVVSTVMTGFFGMLFSFILLTDSSETTSKIMPVAAEYLGAKRTEKVARLLGVVDASFHNFIVRQCIEAGILGVVAGLMLLAIGFPFALGVAALMGLAALVPIVGYPVGLLAGAFMVAIYDGWLALLYIAVVALAQMLEATFVLPYVGDPRTALPPVWVTVGVTIGGGVAGFVGMLVAIPITSTIRQLVIMDVRRRQRDQPPEYAIFPDEDDLRRRRKRKEQRSRAGGAEPGE